MLSEDYVDTASGLVVAVVEAEDGVLGAADGDNSFIEEPKLIAPKPSRMSLSFDSMRSNAGGKFLVTPLSLELCCTCLAISR